MSTGRTILRATALAALMSAAYMAMQPPSGALADQRMPDPSVPSDPISPPLAGTVIVPTSGEAPPANPFGLPCGLTLHAEAMPGAMVALDVMAPCRPDMRVEVEHAGLTVAARTDAVGLLTLDFPAFETPAFFTIRLADGEEAVTLVGLPDLMDIDRVAVSWDGDAAVDLHGFERGAAFGAPGHVWQAAPGSPEAAAIGTGGFLTRLGDPSMTEPRLAQVYSFPRSLPEAPNIFVDIAVTDGTCGEPVTANGHRIAEGGRIDTYPITLVMPGCDAVGDYLVLQNVFETPRLVAN
jgi:hypothetical protein